MNKSGIILVAKQPGITSFKSLGSIKKEYGTKKVGHAGTLDKFAKGLMIVLLGRATKLNSYFSGLDKGYDAVLQLGRETDTLDPEGETLRESHIPPLGDLGTLEEQFRGPQKQLPPKYSAIHIDGKRAYQRTRDGEDVDMPLRDIVVHDLQIQKESDQTLHLSLQCSKGTYVRSLGRDIAQALGSCGHLIELTRTSIGPFLLEEIPHEKVLLSSDEALKRLFSWNSLTLKPEYNSYPKDGRPLDKKCFIQAPEEEGPFFLYREEGDFIGIIEISGGKVNYQYIDRFD